MRRTTGAIFVVTVPATSITSAWRGEKRTTSAPKRLMSNRLAPTAMNSMAQQAVPSGNGHSELLRAQLNSVLRDVTKTFCFTSGGIGTSDSVSMGPVGARSIVWAMMCLSSPIRPAWALPPLQGALAPGVGEAHEQDQDEQRHLHQREQPQPPIGHRPREDEDRLHVEDGKDQRVQVEARVELDVRLADRLHAALVRLLLDTVGVARRDQARNDQRHDGEGDSDPEEQQYGAEGVQHRRPPCARSLAVGSGPPRDPGTPTVRARSRCAAAYESIPRAGGSPRAGSL